MSLPDYDIAGGVPVGCLCSAGVRALGVISGFPAAPAAPASGQFCREGINSSVNVDNSRADRGFVRPAVRIETMGGFSKALTFFGRPGAPGNSVTEFCVTRTQPDRLSAAKRAAEQRLIVNHRSRWRDRGRGLAGGLFFAPL